MRTHLVSVLRCSEEGFICWMGVLCATWVAISRPTTMRSFFRPLGREDLRCVAEGNAMGSITALICLLIVALGGDFCVEQPGSSMLWQHPRLQYICTKIEAGICICMYITYTKYIYCGPLPCPVQVFRASFWMAFFNSPSPKRTCVWSTRPEIRRFWLGRLTQKVKDKMKQKFPGFKTTVQYLDKSGRKRYHGSKQLKQTQKLDFRFAESFSLIELHGTDSKESIYQLFFENFVSCLGHIQESLRNT